MTGELPATIEEDGKLPAERFANAGEVRQVCQQMIKADDKRVAWRAAINGLINGNSPYSKQALRGKNQGWRANVNYQEALGYVNAPQTAFYDLVTENSPCIEVDCDYGEGQQQADWEESIERNYTWLLMKRWRKQLNFHLPLQQREMLVHGLGVHVWPRAYVNNWIPRTPLTGRILFPDECSLDFDQDGEYFMLRDYVPLSTLYGFIRNEGAASAAHWKPKMVWEAMSQTSRSSGNTSNLEEIQRQMKRGDLGTSAKTAGIWLNFLFTREYDTNKKSLYVTAENVETADYLFKWRNRFDDWPLVMFPYDVGDGTIASLRGLGARAKDFFELSNRMKNSMVDQVLMGSMIMLEQTAGVDPEKMRLMKFGVLGLLPQGVKLAMNKTPDLGNGPLALEQHLKGTLRENNEAYLAGTPEPKDRETALSFQMRAQDSAQVSKGTHGLYGSNLCQFHEKVLPMVVKAAKMEGNSLYIKLAKEFRERCRRDGVPDTALDKIVEIREVMSTGAGSAAARIQSYQMAMAGPIYLNASEDKKINMERDYAASLFPGAKVDRFARSLSDKEMPDNDDSFAALENDALSNGNQAIVSPKQNHVKHAQSHLQKAGEIVQAVQQGQMSPEQGLAALQAIGQHIAEHLKQIQGNPLRKREFEQLHKEFLALSNIADQLMQHVQEQQDSQEQAPQEKVSDNLQIGMAKVQADAQVKQAKFANDADIKQRKFALDTRLKYGQAAANTRIAAVKTAAEIQQKRLALTNGQKTA